MIFDPVTIIQGSNVGFALPLQVSVTEIDAKHAYRIVVSNGESYFSKDIPEDGQYNFVLDAPGDWTLILYADDSIHSYKEFTVDPYLTVGISAKLSALPSGYIQLAYIYDTKPKSIKCGIFLDDFPVKTLSTNRLEFDIDLSFVTATNSAAYLYGSCYQYSSAQSSGNPKTGSNREYVMLNINTSKGTFSVSVYSFYKSNGATGSGSGASVITDTYPIGPATIIIDLPKKFVSVNGNVKEVSSTGNKTTTNARKPFLLAEFDVSAGRTSSSVSDSTSEYPGSNACKDVRFKSMRMYESTEDSIGELIHHLLPMKEEATGLIGVYDVVTDRAYVAYTEGTVIAGPEV